MLVAIGLNVLALCLLLGYLLRCAYPLTEAVRLRNALLLEPSSPSDFAWAPPDFPAGFKAETRPASAEFRAIVDAVGAQPVANGPGEWQRSLLLAGHIAERAADKGALQADLPNTYRGVRAGYGYCADFVKVFLALAHAAGITARQWAFSFDGFGGHGHTFVEVYDREVRGWRCLDVHGNFHFVERATGEPLEAQRVRILLAADAASLSLVPNGPGRAAFRYPEKAIAYYQRGVAEWYLWWGNAVFSYYEHPAVAAALRVSRWLAHLVANVLGLQPRIRILGGPENADSVAAMEALRRRIIALAGVFLLLVVALCVQLVLARTHVR